MQNSGLLASIFLLLAGISALGQAQVGRRCNADLVCVVVEKKSQNVTLLLESRTDKPLSFGLFFSDNLAHLNPPLQAIDQPGVRLLTTFAHPGEPWGFDYRIHYGFDPHTHDERVVYRLPYESDSSYVVSQSHTNLSTHRLGNRYAIDWAMPVGTPVFAARGGEVVSTFADSPGNSSGGNASGNHVWVQHDDGSIGKYLHLDQGGVQVGEGETVRSGDAIGMSGNTGYSSGPHLHFSVSTLGGPFVYESLDVRFDTHLGQTSLAGGVSYRHGEQRLVSPVHSVVE